MRLHEHQDAYARRCAELRTEQLLGTLVAIARGLLHVAVMTALVCGVGWLFYEGCGDVLPSAHGEPTPAVEPVPDPPTPAPPDAEVFALMARMRAWQPSWRERQPGELATVASAILTGCRRDPWPDAARCPDLMAALGFRESSWRAGAVGARGEIGTWQIHGAALAGETREAAFDLDVNARLALRWLRTAEGTCRRAGWGARPDFTARVLGAYGGSGCVPSRGAKLVERWADEIAAVTP